jgi:hypothetical protein
MEIASSYGSFFFSTYKKSQIGLIKEEEKKDLSIAVGGDK